MIAKPQNRIGARFQEEVRILRLQVVVLSRSPEIIQDELTILVGQIIKNFFGILSIQLRMMLTLAVAIQTEKRFEVFPRHALTGVVHAPVAAPTGDSDAVDLDDQIGRAGHVFTPGGAGPSETSFCFFTAREDSPVGVSEATQP